MTKKLGLQDFLRMEVNKAKLEIPREEGLAEITTKTCTPGTHPDAHGNPEGNTFRDIFGESEEDYEEDPLQKLQRSKTPFAVKHEAKQKTKISISIEELRKELLAVVDSSFKASSSHERATSARERDRLVRSIERLEAQEQREKGNALRGVATGNLPEPISTFEKKQQQKETELARKALAGEEKIKSPSKRPVNPLDDDPDGETRKLLGLPLKRRKLDKTGKWRDELRQAVPELRYQDYDVEKLKGILLCGASEEQREWLGKWFGRLDTRSAAATGGGMRGSGKGRIL
ncbi:hypothetical protein DSL72_005509 [Monilinia vaccinii-corymbosi]|uniref:Uncharacterized protein n=1 Tax=Monilinia vaccinii-corymbosi TaxID=61207 RepID=A0A8A3PFS0_9HELO|nr:hypothetical protein DSL72_005509 [Monilinia vaccinii-corymbosi]